MLTIEPFDILSDHPFRNVEIAFTSARVNTTKVVEI
ncbi:hypothetical protein Cabther_B0040 [Chloracidobacterium thermophilum B]|uniref:Uncharacterized protein n=1 Tax=Chloracidobacterium thermophilum (strain B) TaxID=981222 RepID=G2LJN1_CHLTF|nr:hypothetical protein Cabther_B0040 [Chloracidobacterium thermophilum B]